MKVIMVSTRQELADRVKLPSGKREDEKKIS